MGNECSMPECMRIIYTCALSINLASYMPHYYSSQLRLLMIMYRSGYRRETLIGWAIVACLAS
eukprot:scaffold294549_cov17-Prasinocladus_malaysianus.AAC.1